MCFDFVFTLAHSATARRCDSTPQAPYPPSFSRLLADFQGGEERLFDSGSRVRRCVMTDEKRTCMPAGRLILYLDTFGITSKFQIFSARSAGHSYFFTQFSSLPGRPAGEGKRDPLSSLSPLFDVPGFECPGQMNQINQINRMRFALF